MDVAEGELGHAERNRTVKRPQRDRASFCRRLLYVAHEGDHKTGVAAHKFKEKLGSFPLWSWNDMVPQPPDAATRAWVKSCQTAFAKAMAKRGAA